MHRAEGAKVLCLDPVFLEQRAQAVLRGDLCQGQTLLHVLNGPADLVARTWPGLVCGEGQRIESSQGWSQHVSRARGQCVLGLNMKFRPGSEVCGARS